MKIGFLFFYLLSVISCCFSQEVDRPLYFKPVWGSEDLIYNKKYTVENDEIIITEFTFYVSDISFLKDEKIVFQPSEKYFLLNFESNLNIPIHIDSSIDYNAIRFNLGIDSLTNVSGAMGGDLDPTKGMYWTWQSGFINFKLEGTSMRCNTKNKQFEFHIGGYAYPYETLQKITINTNRTTKLEILIDIEKFFDGIDLAETNAIVSPGADALKMAKTFGKIFSIRQ